MTGTPPAELPADLAALAAVDLTGAQLQEWSANGDAFSWTLLTGDDRRGHELVHLDYVGAVVLHVTARDLEGAVTGRAEVVRAEVVPAEDGGWEHHVTVRAAYRLVVRFWSVDVRRMPTPGHLRRR